MSLKKISKDQPNEFVFNDKSLKAVNKQYQTIQTTGNKVQLCLYYILLKNKMIIGYH